MKLFLFQFAGPGSKQFHPEIGNPQNADRNGGHHHHNPRNPNPPRNQSVGGAADVKRPHPVHEIRSHKATDNRIQNVKWRRQKIIHFSCKLQVASPGVGERPDVLAEAGDLGEDQEGENGECAVGGDVAAGEEDEERGEVVADEEDVAGEEDEVVEEIGEEVGDAVVEDGVLEKGVGGGESGGGVGEDGVSGEEYGGGAVGEGD
ncbi:hypothetical protein DVH24_031648 [Malus domestica]|uniref:Uncharacterized protein n=1 Tax=Malus domestica TaxID=3750 RepID=A0A498J795_MALDO|nr:hypothetical protein DVH24_031648 [Malus domestica]